MNNQVIIHGQFTRICTNQKGTHVLMVRIRGRLNKTVEVVLDKVLDRQFKTGDYVIVKGRMVGFEYQNYATQLRKQIQYVLFESIEKATSEMQEVFGEEGISFPRQTFDCFLDCFISEITEHELFITLRGEGEDTRPVRLRLMHYGSATRKIRQMQRGDRVYILSEAMENKSNQDNTYCSLIIKDIVKGEKNDGEKGQF